MIEIPITRHEIETDHTPYVEWRVWGIWYPDEASALDAAEAKLAALQAVGIEATIRPYEIRTPFPRDW